MIIQEYADKLCVSLDELRKLLDATDRTFKRWMNYPTRIPGPVIACLKAWYALHSAGAAWQPNQITIFLDSNGKICALDLDDKKMVREWKRMSGIPEIDQARLSELTSDAKSAVRKIAINNNIKKNKIELTIKFHDEDISPDPIEFSVKP